MVTGEPFLIVLVLLFSIQKAIYCLAQNALQSLSESL
jgi:hypothetical protein